MTIYSRNGAALRLTMKTRCGDEAFPTVSFLAAGVNDTLSSVSPPDAHRCSCGKNDIIVMAPQAGGFADKREGLIWEAHIHDNR